MSALSLEFVGRAWLPWVVALGLVGVTGHWAGLGSVATKALMLAGLGLGIVVLAPESLRVYRQGRIGQSTRISRQWLERWARRYPDRWLLGQGAAWHARHTQALHQTLDRAGPDTDEPALLCQVGWLRPVFLEGLGAIGHTLVMGAPGTGKTQLFHLLALQAIARGEAVILLDPKGGSRLRQSLAHAAERVGRPYFQLLPADPARSDCLDLLANGRQASELASRLCRLIPADESENAFGQFAWMTLHRILEGLLILREPVTLKALHFHVSDQGKALRVRLQAMGVDALSGAWRGITDLAAHDVTHYRKMILALTPVLETLTAGALGDLLSPPLAADTVATPETRPRFQLAQIIRQAGVLYAGLGALSDEAVARALGGLLLADLAAVAGDRYRDAGAGVGVRVFVDEAAEVTNPAFIQLLNKGRECGMVVTFAVQTLADLEVAMNGSGPARMMVGNAGNLIAFRTLDPESRKVWAERAGTTWVRTTSASVSAQRAQGLSGWRRGVGAGRSEQLQETPLIPEAFLGHLPNLHFVGLLGGNRVVVGRLALVH